MCNSGLYSIRPLLGGKGGGGDRKAGRPWERKLHQYLMPYGHLADADAELLMLLIIIISSSNSKMAIGQQTLMQFPLPTALRRSCLFTPMFMMIVSGSLMIMTMTIALTMTTTITTTIT